MYGCNYSSRIRYCKKLSSSLFHNYTNRSFSSSVYMWSARMKLSRRPTDLKQQFSIKSGVPTKLTFFDNKNPKKLYIGPRHTSIITTDGSLYTFGAGSWGALGHGDEKSLQPTDPQLVEYFADKNIKVKSCKLGEYHSAVLTEDGEVYTFGYGGKEGYFAWMVSQEVGALGHGNRKPFFLPKKVQYFDEIGAKVKQIAAGLYHTVALTEDGDLYTWGRGQYGVLGNGTNQYCLTPTLNEDFAIMKEDGINVVKIDAADEYTAVLMDNGDVYTFGKNDRGQMGIDSGIGIDMLESCANPTPLVFDQEEIPNIVDVY